MKLHGNARTCPKSRRLLVERIESPGWSLATAAEAAGVSERTAYRWLARWREEGELGLLDRSSAPRSIPHRTPGDRVRVIEALRRLRMTAAEIAEVLGMALSTVSAVLKRIGLGKRSRLEPPEPPNRYERKRPGELVHLDIKKLGRIGELGAGHRVTGHRASQHQKTINGKRRRPTGWEFVHVAVDDATRLAYAEVLADERGPTAAAFLRRAVSWFGSLGIAVERIITDNGACYRSDAHATACKQLAIQRHLFTRPYRPRTNGKAERFIQTLINRWAYGAIYGSSTERTQALPGWLNHYNFTRQHGSLSHKPPGTRLRELTNPPRNYS
jgi:transposase InsO family protein